MPLFRSLPFSAPPFPCGSRRFEPSHPARLPDPAEPAHGHEDFANSERPKWRPATAGAARRCDHHAAPRAPQRKHSQRSTITVIINRPPSRWQLTAHSVFTLESLQRAQTGDAGTRTTRPGGRRSMAGSCGTAQAGGYGGLTRRQRWPLEDGRHQSGPVHDPADSYFSVLLRDLTQPAEGRMTEHADARTRRRREMT